MADGVIILRVLRQSPRTDLLLEQVGQAVTDLPLVADDHGTVEVRAARRAPQVWDAVRDALDEAGSDWRQWLHLSARPKR
jgi:hypothetical protein